MLLANYGESQQSAHVAGISLAVHTMNARIFLVPPVQEGFVEQLIITNDHCTASVSGLPDRDGRDLRRIIMTTQPARLAPRKSARPVVTRL